MKITVQNFPAHATPTMGGRDMTARTWIQRTAILSIVAVLALGVAPEADAADRNLAKGKKASQSSNFTNSAGSAAMAVDGKTDGRWAMGSVSHTKLQKSAWWQVDLGKVYQINKIRIHNRTDCCAQRLATASVLVSRKPFKKDPLKKLSSDITYVHGLSSQKLIKLDIGREGRYVRIQQPDTQTEHLGLAEVEVMGHSTRLFS